MRRAAQSCQPSAAGFLGSPLGGYLFGPKSRCTFTCASDGSPSTKRGSYFHFRTAANADFSNISGGVAWMTATSSTTPCAEIVTSRSTDPAMPSFFAAEGYSGLTRRISFAS
jgi:hypothetical protein